MGTEIEERDAGRRSGTAGIVPGRRSPLAPEASVLSRNRLDSFGVPWTAHEGVRGSGFPALSG